MKSGHLSCEIADKRLRIAVGETIGKSALRERGFLVLGDQLAGEIWAKIRVLKIQEMEWL